MNEIIMYYKNEPYKLYDAQITQEIFNKNYNKILELLNNENFKTISKVFIDDNILNIDLVGHDGLFFKKTIELNIV